MTEEMGMYEARGKIKLISDLQTFNSGFTKREFVITTEDSKYPQDIKFETARDKTALLDNLQVGQEVSVSFDIRGNEYNGKYYVNLNAWKIQAGGQQQQQAPANNFGSEPSFVEDNSFGEPSVEDLRGDEPPF